MLKCNNEFLPEEEIDQNLEVILTKSSSYDLQSSIIYEDEISSKQNFRNPNDVIFKSIGLLTTSKESSGKGLLKSMAESITSLKDTLKFNLITSNKQANLKKEDFLVVGGTKFNKDHFNGLWSKPHLKKGKEKSSVINEFISKNFIYLSYRSGFSELKALNSNLSGYTSDCGWGCMVRSAQMILSRAILSAKLHNNLLSKNIDNENLTSISRIETILLLSDNFLNTSDVLGNPDFDFYKIKQNKQSKLTRVSSLIQCDIIDADEIDLYITNRMIPPFSIQLISLLGESYGKGAGKTFSDINCIQIFEELNSEMRPIPNFDIMWTENIVSEEEIVSRFLEKVCVPNKGHNYYLYRNEAYKLKQLQPRYSDSVSHNEEALTVSGALFISIRLGLNSIASEYFPSIFQTFSMQGSLGMIGGENNKGFYYIGANSNNELLFLDPHFNQKSFCSREELLSTFYDSYNPHYVYKIKINKISPAFTLGFNFNNISEFATLMSNLKQLSEGSFQLLKFVDKKKELIRKSLICTEVDDFDLIDFEEIDQACKL